MRSKIFSGLTLAAVLMGAVACSNYTDPSLNAKKGLLVKAPEVYVYSGGQEVGNGALTSRKGANTEGNKWSETWDCVPNVNLSEGDMKAIKDLLCFGEPVENTQILPFKNYWVQQVYTGETTYVPTDAFGDDCTTEILGSVQMNQLCAYDGNPWVTNWDSKLMQNVPHPYCDINNFNRGDNQSGYGTDNGCGITHKGTTLMTDMPTEGMTASNQFGYKESYGSSFYNNYYIIQYKGEWYVGFDYETHKNVGNKNEAADVERDWCFTDWIVKITPAYAKGTTPENPNTGDNNDGDDEGDEGDETPENPDPETPDFPDVVGPDGEKCNEHVEINFAVEEHNDFNAAHLSMHLRAATDIEVFIPVPAEYYCQQDDMYIVEQHAEGAFEHGGFDALLEESTAVVTRTINGHVVTLTIEYKEDGLHLTTDGMCQEVLEYLQEVYGDGLTFEVWSYFNESTNRKELRDHFKENKATVKFLDEEPCFYVNAFYDGAEQMEFDLPVVIVDEQAGDYNDPQQGLHYNGSVYNHIYTRSDLEVVDNNGETTEE